MPNNEGKGGKKRVKKLKLSERGKNENENVKRELVFKEDGQEYAQVTKMLGQGRLEALCFDGVKRLCHIRGKLKVWIKQSDIVLIALRDYQDEKADVIWRYSLDEARDLKAYGEIPESAKINDAEMVSMSEKLVHTWLLEPHKPWLDLDPVTMLPLQPITLVGSNKYPSTEVGLRARQGLLLRQHRAHRGAGGRGRAATARQQEQRRQQADDANNNVRDPTAEQGMQQGFLIKEIRPLQDHTPRIELRQHAADDKLYYHVHGVVGLPLVLPASGLGPMEDPMQPGEQLLKVGHATSVRLQELSYEYTLEVAASSKKKEEDAATCPICLDGLSTNVRVLMCKHKFHPVCIDKWCRKREGDKKSCPNCRQVLWG